MRVLRRLLVAVAVATLLVAAAFATGIVLEDNPAGRPTASGTGAPETPAPTPEPPTPTATPATTPAAAPSRTPSPTRTPKPTPTPTPTLIPGVPLLSPGDAGDDVRDLQARLKQIYWFNADVTGTYGEVTTAAVRGFQAKREIPVTGKVDQRTLNRLHAMTTAPTVAELHNRANQPGALDPRCRSGRVLCIDKTSQTLRWVVGGQVLQTVDVRFGGSATPTREGLFHVYVKSRDHVSRLYGSPMPFAMFFSGGQAVHYSSDFASVGYNGASHGCVNVRDYDAIAALFDKVAIGDPVVVYRS
ncbi:MAG: L,D-transpeptidase family protein [Nocardioides sp.]